MQLRQFYEAVLPAQGHYALFLADTKQHVWAETIEDLVDQTESRGGDQGIYFATGSFKAPTNRTAANVLHRRSICFDIDAGVDKVAKHGDKVYATQVDAYRALIAWCDSTHAKPAYVLSSGAGLHVYFLLDRDLTVAEWKPIAEAVKANAMAGGLRIDASVTADAARILRPPGTLHPNGELVRILAATPAVYAPDALRALFPVAAPRRERSINDDVLDAPVGPPKSLNQVLKQCAAMSYVARLRGDVAEPYWRATLGIVKFTVEGAPAAHAISEGHPEYDHARTQAKLDRWTAGPTTCATFEVENPQACASCPHKGKVKSPIVLGAVLGADPVAPPPVAAPAVPWSVVDEADEDDAPTPGALPGPATTESDPGPWFDHIPHPEFKVRRVPGGYVMTHWRRVERPAPGGKGVVREMHDVPFCSVPFWFDSWAVGTDDADQAGAVFRVFNATTSEVSSYNLPTRHTAKRDSLLTALASQNIIAFNPHNPTLAKVAMDDFVKASLEKMRHAGQRQKITDRFGTLYTRKGEVIVAQGAHVITADGDIYEAVVQEKLRQRVGDYRIALPVSDTGGWDATVWDAHICPRALRHAEYLREFYADPNFRPYQLAIMLAWASPMMAFMEGSYHADTRLPGMGLSVSLYSPRSGIGKTAAMRAAALAFGAPAALVPQLDASNSTDNARLGRLLQSGTLPSFMDEMENLPAPTLAALISTVGNGASKSRMTKELSIEGGIPLALVNLMSTNKSHRELAAADRTESPAVQLRLLEIDCSAVQTVTRDVGDRETRARSALHDCVGAVGAMLHREMCRAGGDRLNQLGMKAADTARGLLDGKQDGRFMWRALGAMLATRALLQAANPGLDVFNTRELVAEFKKWHDAGYEFSNERILPTEGVDMLSMLLSDLAAYTLVTGTESHRVGGDKSGKVDLPMNDRVPDNVLARGVLPHLSDDGASAGGHIYIKTDAIRDWCFKRKVSHQGLISRCRDAGVFEPPNINMPTRFTRQVDLYKGTRMAQGVRSSVFKVLIHKLNNEPDYRSVVSGNVVALKNPGGPRVAPEPPGAAASVSG